MPTRRSRSTGPILAPRFLVDLSRIALGLILFSMPTTAPSATLESPLDFHRAWAWSGSGFQLGVEGLEAADLDGDGRLEIVASAGAGECCGYAEYWHISHYNGDLVQRGTSFEVPDGILGLDVVNVDGRYEVAVLTPFQVLIFDGASQEPLRAIPIPIMYRGAFAVADLDGTGGLEMVVVDDVDLRLFDYSTGILTATRYGFGGSELAIGQIDSDPALEIAIAGNPIGGFVLDGASLQVDWGRVDGFGGHVRLADFDSDSFDEVVVQNPTSWAAQAWDPRTGEMLWQTSDGAFIVRLETADLDLDGDQDLLVMTRAGSALDAFDGRTGSLLWSVPVPTYDPSRAIVADLDGDGAPEIFSGNGDSYGSGPPWIVVDLSPPTLHSVGLSLRGPFPGLALGNMNGDGGSSELVTTTGDTSDLYSGTRELRFDLGAQTLTEVGDLIIGGYDASVRSASGQLDSDSQLELCITMGSDFDVSTLQCVDGVTHATEWEVGFTPGTTLTGLAVVELDGDSFPEVLVGAQPSRIYAFEGESGVLKWTSPALSAAHSSLATIRVGNIDDDGAVEVVVGGGNLMAILPGITVLDAETGALKFGPHLVRAWSFDLAQLDADEPLEIVVGTYDGELRAFDPETGAVSAPLLALSDPIQSLKLADLNRDGVSDIAFTSSGRIQVLDGGTGAVVWESPYLHRDVGLNDSLYVEDVGNNSVPDILVNTSIGFAWFEAPLFELFADGFESGDTSAWSATVP